MFKFQFDLHVLNHLGRGLYRNFATVVAEAVSNAWDADATKVEIFIDQAAKTMSIKDNGKGMSGDDFQNKFLKVGYARRDDPDSRAKRKVLGRKGIGKLAMLSVSSAVTIRSKKSGCEETGGVVDNAQLDTGIKENKEYPLGELGAEKVFADGETGTYLRFDGIKDTVNRPEIIRKYLAVMFNFSFSSSNEKFDIYLNGDKVSPADLRELHDGTGRVWHIGEKIPGISRRFANAEQAVLDACHFLHDNKTCDIKGYVASVSKVSILRVRGSGLGSADEFRAGVHLFTNGRLRQENVFDEFGSDRLVMRYLYGEIHVDSFDDDSAEGDIFTSNREGVIRDSGPYRAFLAELDTIRRRVVADWDKWRENKAAKKFGNADFDGMKSGKKKILAELLGKKDDEFTAEFVAGKIKQLVPEKSGKKILICHSSQNKNLGDKVERELLARGFQPREILYSSSGNEESAIPAGEDIFEYIKKFFVQDWYDNPLVVFVTSAEMETSWGASLEAGATWVTGAEHRLAVAEKHNPKLPLNIGRLFVAFDDKGEFKNPGEAKRVFDEIRRKFNK